MYFLLTLAVRLTLSLGLAKDEAEQALLAQAFAWGYHLQPPLYTWLQRPFVEALGYCPLAFLLLR